MPLDRPSVCDKLKGTELHDPLPLNGHYRSSTVSMSNQLCDYATYIHFVGGTGSMASPITMPMPIALKQSHIIVAEDDPGIAALMQDLLQEEGYSVSVLQLANNAFEEIAQTLPDLVILDMTLAPGRRMVDPKQAKAQPPNCGCADPCMLWRHPWTACKTRKPQRYGLHCHREALRY